MTGRRPTIVLLVALLSTGCAANEATPAPTTSPNPSPSPSAVGTPLAIPTATPTPVPTASPTAVPIGDWKEVPAKPSVKGAQFQDVAWTGLRFVAVAVAMSGGGEFLDSTNGSTWDRQSDLNANAHPTRLAAGPGGVVAVGAIGERPASWFSTDGVAWTPRRDAFPVPDVGDDTVTVTDVVARGNGWLAVGRQDPICQIDCGTTARRGLAWTSSNGSEWTLIPGQAAFKGAGLNAVTRRADEFAAVGGAGGHAVILTSPDGLKWSRVPDDPMFGSRASGDGPPVAATAVAWDDGALVVLGMVQSEAIASAPGGRRTVARGRGPRSTRRWTVRCSAQPPHRLGSMPRARRVAMAAVAGSGRRPTVALGGARQRSPRSRASGRMRLRQMTT